MVREVAVETTWIACAAATGRAIASLLSTAFAAQPPVTPQLIAAATDEIK